MTNAQPKKTILTLFSIGIALINAGLFGLVLILLPIINQELNYSQHQHQLAKLTAQAAKKDEPIIQAFNPVDKQFTLIIPKININAPVIASVNPFNSAEYQAALKKGVAHAKNSALPDEAGSTFLFAHSTGSLLTVDKYNAIFYLLNKIEKKDKIWLVYEDKNYQYSVNKILEVAAKDVQYLEQEQEKEQNQLILMTCSPPGTDLKRLLIFAQLED